MFGSGYARFDRRVTSLTRTFSSSTLSRLAIDYPVLFSFPVFLAHASMRTKAQSPSGNSIAPINPRISNSCVTADKGAPAKYSAVELGLPTPNNLRHADSV